MPADIISQWQAYIDCLLPVIQTLVLVMLIRVWVCEYALFFFTSAFTISVRQTRLVMKLKSIRLGKVRRVITDQTASEQTVIPLWRIPGSQDNNAGEGFVRNDITCFLWKRTLR